MQVSIQEGSVHQVFCSPLLLNSQLQRRCMVKKVKGSGQHKDTGAMQVFSTSSNAIVLYEADVRSHHHHAAKRHVACSHRNDLEMTATSVDVLILQRRLHLSMSICLSTAPILSIVNRLTHAHDVKLVIPLHVQAPAGSTYHAITITRVISSFDQGELNCKLHVHLKLAAEKSD